MPYYGGYGYGYGHSAVGPFMTPLERRAYLEQQTEVFQSRRSCYITACIVLVILGIGGIVTAQVLRKQGIVNLSQEALEEESTTPETEYHKNAGLFMVLSGGGIVAVIISMCLCCAISKGQNRIRVVGKMKEIEQNTLRRNSHRGSDPPEPPLAASVPVVQPVYMNPSYGVAYGPYNGGYGRSLYY